MKVFKCFNGLLLLVFALSPQLCSAADSCFDAVEQGAYDMAIEFCSESIASGDFSDAERSISYNNRGRAWFNKGEYDEAISDYNEAIQLDPDNAHPYNNRGWTRHLAGAYEKAIADYEKAIEMDPYDVESYRHLAWLLASATMSLYRDGQRAVKLADDQDGHLELFGHVFQRT